MIPRVVVALLLLIALLAGGSESTRAAQETPTPTPIVAPDRDDLEEAVVMEVVDGDTIEVRREDTTLATVRLIGVDTPETVHPSQPVGCFGLEASDFTQEILTRETTVWLEKDVSETDRYDRLLRYVWVEAEQGNEAWDQLVEDGLLDEDVVEDGELVLFNHLLVRAGYGLSSTYPPDVKYQDHFLLAERQARENEVGLWGECQNVQGESSAAAPTAPTTGAECDPSYPDVCIPPAPPDLDCGQIADRRFTVLPPDPHGFDGDHDGIGCES